MADVSQLRVSDNLNRPTHNQNIVFGICAEICSGQRCHNEEMLLGP